MLSEIFVVSLSSLNVEWRSHAIAHYWDTLGRHALGNYRDLLGDITLNPAMGLFLNTKKTKRKTTKGASPIKTTRARSCNSSPLACTS